MSRPRVALTVGKFDGVHRGHRHVLAALGARAAALGVARAAVVLDPHPATVLAGVKIPALTTAEERLARLAEAGVDHPCVLTFDRALAGLSPAAFLERLAERFEVAEFVVGPDFVFGRDRSGDRGTLAALGAARGFGVTVVAPLAVDGAPVSSARIRAALAEGAVARAADLLGRPHRLSGPVVRGARRGRTLGFPTANVATAPDAVLPADGVYAVRASWHDAAGRRQTRDGAANLGVRPQFDAGARLLEVYLLDFEGEVYGRTLEVDFVARLRPEARFPSVEALVAQMGRDVADARRALARAGGAAAGAEGDASAAPPPRGGDGAA